MLNSFDIALLCDSRTVDGAGKAITLDRSRHGIHAQLGDGTTGTTMPTLDALDGRFTFDGDDYMVLRAADDVDDVLAKMGSIQDETYCWLFDPWLIQPVPGGITEPFRKNIGNSSIYFRFSHNNDTAAFSFISATGAAETTTISNAFLGRNNRRLLMVLIRQLNSLRFYIGTELVGSGTDSSEDASSSADVYLGTRDETQYFFANGTGLRAFLYGQFAATQILLRQLSRYFRGLL